MAVNPIPSGYHTITPYLTARNASEAIEFYKTAFGAIEVGRLVMPDGGIAHAEVEIGDSKIMISEESEDWGNLSPEALNGSPVNLCIYVEDVDASFAQALAAGASTKTEVEDQFYGDRMGTLIDPFGHIWTLMTHKEDLSFEEMQTRMDEMFA